jgi:hypothetical protein
MLLLVRTRRLLLAFSGCHQYFIILTLDITKILKSLQMECGVLEMSAMIHLVHSWIAA